MSAPWPLLVIAAVLGLAVGSFLNVVIHRVPRGESVVAPPSHCPGCDSLIKKRHNVPVVGWLVLRGRCAGCGMRISARYPLVEAGTAVLFVAVTARAGIGPALPAFLYLAAIGVALVMIDVDLRRLPLRLVLPSYAVVAVAVGATAADDGSWALPLRVALGGAALAGAALAVPAARALLAPVRRPLRRDDLEPAALAGLVGLYLGWVSWPALAVGAGVALLATAARGPARRPLPAGAVLLVAGLATVLVLLPTTGAGAPVTG